VVEAAAYAPRVTTVEAMMVWFNGSARYIQLYQ
jgi:hypothetical protein